MAMHTAFPTVVFVCVSRGFNLIKQRGNVFCKVSDLRVSEFTGLERVDWTTGVEDWSIINSPRLKCLKLSNMDMQYVAMF